MAEGWAKAIKSDSMESYSAGIEKTWPEPNAVQVMQEAGVDITSHQSNTVEELGPVEFDYVITVCGHADENCPVFQGHAKIIHHGFDDPPKLAKEAPDEATAIECYRRVRDEIKSFVETLPGSLHETP